jgi:hypothetical protein
MIHSGELSIPETARAAGCHRNIIFLEDLFQYTDFWQQSTAK